MLNRLFIALSLFPSLAFAQPAVRERPPPPPPPGRPLARPQVGPPQHGASAVVPAPIVPGFRVNIAPPAARVEVRPMAPSQGHVWIDGHWRWRGNRHLWEAGYWELPPSTGYHWVAARWVNEGGAWMFYDGYWDPGYTPVAETPYEPPPAPPEPVYAEEQPPQNIVEVRPVVPFAGAVWIPGYWHIRGHHQRWIGGHWSAPREGHRWEEGRWEHDRRHYRWVPGGWRR